MNQEHKDLTSHREHLEDIKRLIYVLLLFNIILNMLTWYPQIKCYLYGATGEESKFYWLMALNIYALSGGALFYLFSVMLFPKEITFWLFLFNRSVGDVSTNLADLGYVDKYDVTIWAVKTVITLTVLTLTIQKLKTLKNR